MRIPKSDVVSFVLKEALRGRSLNSQHELTEVLNSRLRRNNPDFSVSKLRARRIALASPGITTEILTRRGRPPSRCPACGHYLRKTFTKNLKGKRLLFRISCSRCPYKASGGKWAPKRYIFRG